jgi:FlaA1/EpsC-like NDP-sugar epimerase
MKTSIRDLLSGVLVILSAVVLFAKLQSYSWWLIGSWKGALGVIAVLGVGMFLANLMELIRFADIPSFLETFMWAVAATVILGSLFSTTTKAEFVSSSVVVWLAWLAQITRHLWRADHSHHRSHFSPVH